MLLFDQIDQVIQLQLQFVMLVQFVATVPYFDWIL